MIRPALLAVLFCLALPWATSSAQVGDAPVDEKLDVPGLVAKCIDEGLSPMAAASDIWSACYTALGDMTPALDHLVSAEKENSDQRYDFVRMRASLLVIRGDRREARELFESIDEAERTRADRLAIAELLDREGNTSSAVEAYGLLLKEDLDPALADALTLRVALMTQPKKGEKSPLAQHAAGEGRTEEARNQAALILALQNRHKEAIDLYVVSDSLKGTARFRVLVRLAEWSMEADALDRAESRAWDAFTSAKLRRDRRYSAGVLVEAHRRNSTLNQLVDRLAAEENLSNEGRGVWIDLLRETGRTAEALTLFRSGEEGGFTVQMQRELLEICRETGTDKTLVDAYTELIKTEPRFIEWREGLARHYLERGLKSSAVAVWSDYLQVTNEHRYVMAAAAALGNLGLDEEAMRFARSSIADEALAGEALMFCFQLHRERGRLEKAAECLEELDQTAPADSVARVDLADGLDRLGKKKRAAEVLTDLRRERGEASGLDLAMKLAVLLSTVGEEDRALSLWQELWRQTTSVARRRYVEDRLMTVAARLGKLARIAIDIEQRLIAGKADALDAGLLVRIYTRVKDPVSATEIIEEHMGSHGAKAAEVLQEKARVFLSCDDYFNYEKTVHDLIIADPENRGDYLRQLAMSHLERGKRDEAREILDQLKLEQIDSASSEFEAGILVMAGLKEEALVAYKKGLARNPERIDTYLLLSNVQRELGRSSRSAGMFQHLAATAKKDDLFTIAIDGLLNLRAGNNASGAPNSVIEWARRVALERLARRPSKLYLYRLVADLSDELNDKVGNMEALKAALPIAGEQRTSLLRELMTLAKGGGRSTGIIRIVNGRIQRGGRKEASRDELMFGRRLLSQGEIVPPQVYLDLGGAFLAGHEVVNAARTFNQASRLPEFASLQRDIAKAFEEARYPDEALRIFERILTVEHSDVTLILKVASLQESLGRDAIAADLYARGLSAYLDLKPIRTTKKVDDVDATRPRSIFLGRNVEEMEAAYQHLIQGFLAAADHIRGEKLVHDLSNRLSVSLDKLESLPVEDRGKVGAYPRLMAESTALRKMALGYGLLTEVDALDQRLIHLLPNDSALMESMCRMRIQAGYLKKCRVFIEVSGQPDDVQARLTLLAGGLASGSQGGLLSPEEISGLVLPLLLAGENDGVRRLLERVDLGGGGKGDLEAMETLVSAAASVSATELGLGLCRHWFKLQTIHNNGAVYGVVEQLIGASGRFLTEKQHRSLIRYIVDSVCEEPKKFRAFINQMPELKKIVGEDLISTEQVESLISGRLQADGDFTYGIPQLIGLRPQEERASLVRGIWPLVSKAQRAWFLLDLLENNSGAMNATLADFIVAQAEQVEAAKSELSLQFQIQQLGDTRDENLEVAMRVLSALQKSFPSNKLLPAIRPKLLKRLGRTEEALDEALALLPKVLTGSKKDIIVSRGSTSVIETAAKLDPDRTLAVLDEVVESEGSSLELWKKRAQVLFLADRIEEQIAAQIAAAEEFPKDIALLNTLKSNLTRRSRSAEAADVQARIVALQPKAKAGRERLKRLYLSLRNPIHALEYHDAKDVTTADSKTNPGATREPRKEANIAALKTATLASNTDEARLQARRLWRNWYSGRTRIFFVGRTTTRKMLWPADARKPLKKKLQERSRGGLPSLLDRRPKALSASDVDGDEPAKPKVKRSTVEDVLATHEFGRDELRRRLRYMTEHDDASDIYAALASDLQARGVAGAELDRLLKQQESGEVGRHGFGVLFALLQTDLAESFEGIDAVLTELLANADQQDLLQLRRLANLIASTGNEKTAATLYQWCALRSAHGGRAVRAEQGLLDDAMSHLNGELREATVHLILQSSSPTKRNYWGLENHHSLSLDTYTKLLGEKNCLARCNAIIDVILKPEMSPERNAALKAAALLSRNGQLERAVGCLEIALCKLTPPSDLRYPWYRRNFESPGFLSINRLNSLFPKGTESNPVSPEWLRAATTAVLGWQKDDRLNKRTIFPLLALLTQRLHEANLPELASNLLVMAAARANNNANNLLWTADLHRRMGDSSSADKIELRLLQTRRLHVERIPEAITRLQTSTDSTTAFLAAETAATYTLHPKLLTLLCTLATQTSQPNRLTHWQSIQTQCEAALKALKLKK